MVSDGTVFKPRKGLSAAPTARAVRAVFRASAVSTNTSRQCRRETPKGERGLENTWEGHLAGVPLLSRIRAHPLPPVCAPGVTPLRPRAASVNHLLPSLPHAGRACAAPGLTSRDHPGSSTRLAPRQDMFTPCLFNSSVFVSTPEAECDFGATSPLTTLAELLPKQLYHMPRWAFDFGSLNITFLWKQALRIATPINGVHPNS